MLCLMLKVKSSSLYTNMLAKSHLWGARTFL